MQEEPTAEEDRIAKEIVDSSIKVHRAMGPGLLESVYEVCLEDELTVRGFDVERQVPIPVTFNNRRLDAGFRADLIVNKKVLIEVKSINALSGLQDAQVLTYLKFSKIRLGLLMNFNVKLMKEGLKRFFRSESE